MTHPINKDTKVITQGITGKTGQFHTRMCRDYANGKNCFVAGVNPKKAGEDFEGIPIFATVQGSEGSRPARPCRVIYVPPAGAAAAIWEAVEADLDLVDLHHRRHPGARHDRRARQDRMARPAARRCCSARTAPA